MRLKPTSFIIRVISLFKTLQKLSLNRVTSTKSDSEDNLDWVLNRVLTFHCKIDVVIYYVFL